MTTGVSKCNTDIPRSSNAPVEDGEEISYEPDECVIEPNRDFEYNDSDSHTGIGGKKNTPERKVGTIQPEVNIMCMNNGN